MKRKEILYVGGIVLVILVLFIARSGNQPLNWNKSFSRYDKNPYGSYALGELLHDIVPNHKVETSNNTLYEIGQADSSVNFLVIAESFYPDDESMTKLLTHVADGHEAFISAMYFSAHLLDTLGLSMGYEETAIMEYLENQDSTTITLYDNKAYEFGSLEFGEYIDKYPGTADVLGENKNEHPVAMRVPFGNGYFILNTTPIVFTNYFMLYKDNAEAASTLLSFLPVADIHWTDYYQVGRLKSSSPLRTILEYPSMKIALYITLGLIILYLLFQSKRKQRLIPIVSALPNYTLQFIKTIGTLYYQSGDHKAMIMNRIGYFKEYLGVTIGVRWARDSQVVDMISAKSGLDRPFVENLCDNIKTMEANERPSREDIFELNKGLEDFYNRRTQKLSNI